MGAQRAQETVRLGLALRKRDGASRWLHEDLWTRLA